jgi:hypothetical protein
MKVELRNYKITRLRDYEITRLQDYGLQEVSTSQDFKKLRFLNQYSF